MRRSVARSLPSLLVLLLAVALVAVGWGHRLPQGAVDASQRLQAFVQAGGDAGDLCGGTARAAARCDACRLTDAPGRPDPAFGLARAMEHGAVPQQQRLSMAVPDRRCHPAWHGRAPPLV